MSAEVAFSTNELAQRISLWLLASSLQLALFIGLVALSAMLLQRASPRLRHGLWLLVLLKVFLPPTLGADWSFGQWGLGPVHSRMASPLRDLFTGSSAAQHTTAAALTDTVSVVSSPDRGLESTLLVVWFAGCMAVWGIALSRYTRHHREADRSPEIDEGPIRVALEQARANAGVSESIDIDLRLTQNASSPCLIGLIRPRILLPASLAEGLPVGELEAVLTHELIHWRRRDLWIGWLQVAALGLFWFHPLLWWAAARLRHERECVCDEAVLLRDACSPETYGEALVHTLKLARGAAPPIGAVAGVFEHGSLLQERLERVMNFDRSSARFGWASAAGLALFAVVFLPMSSSAKSGSKPLESAEKTSYPVVVSTSPAIGAEDIEPSLDEIRVTFDREMSGGMSWTGGGEFFPQSDSSQQARWIDKRTCVLPVKLKRGAFYRVGINSKSYENFKSANGAPAAHGAIYFTTKGAKRSDKRKLGVPAVARMKPKNRAAGVDPATALLSVTFDTPMGGGMSWTRAGGVFPETGQGSGATWSKDGKTCRMLVELQPETTYRLGLNASHAVNFQSKWGVPLEPVVWEFTTGPDE